MKHTLQLCAFHNFHTCPSLLSDTHHTIQHTRRATIQHYAKIIIEQGVTALYGYLHLELWS